MDCDQIVCGDISELWTTPDVDVMGVLNSNPKEAKTYPVQVWDIHPGEYLNAGLVVMRSEQFIRNWLGLCMGPRFMNYQFREQDILSILVHYGPYKTKVLDFSSNLWGLSSRQYEPKMILKENKLILPKGEDGYPNEDKVIKVWHRAGGSIPNKMNFHTLFNEEVSDWMDKLTI